MGHVLEWLAAQLAARTFFNLLPDWAKWVTAIGFLLLISVIIPAFLYLRARKQSA